MYRILHDPSFIARRMSYGNERKVRRIIRAASCYLQQTDFGKNSFFWKEREI
jgi:Holliday junction resolvase-like predicted endonuclease